MATIPAAGYISNAARTQSEIQTAWEDVIASVRQIPGAGQTELSLTIASGSITPAGSGGVLVVDTEASAATDDLTNIVQTNYPDGSCILMRNNNNTRFVVLKHLAGGAGQISLDRAVDCTLDDTNKWILLERRSTSWFEVFRGPQRLASFTAAKSSTYTVAREDVGKVFPCTGTFTLGITAAASLGNGFIFGVKNVSTGQITVDPNSSELIDGATTLVVMPGWSYWIFCDGSAWRTLSSTGPQPAQNPIINGTFEVWQRNTTFVAAANGAYTADRWAWLVSGAAVATINRSTNVPTVAQAGVAFNYSLEVDITTADASIAAGDNASINYYMEGSTWRHFAQRQLTISFWVMSTKTGTHCVSLRNAGSDRSYVAEYTVSVTNTWEYKTVTVLASPSAPGGPSWNYTIGIGIVINFTLATGSTFQTTAGAWQTGNFIGTSNQVNCLDSTSNFFRLAGVKMELGANATPLDVISFDQEYTRCLRYYQKSFNYTTAPATNIGSSTGEYIFPQTVGASTVFNTVSHPLYPMRTAPTMTYFNPNAANAQVRNRNTNTDCTGTSSSQAQEKTFTITATTPGGSSSSQTLAVHWTAEAEL